MSKDDLNRLYDQERRRRALKSSDPNYILRPSEQMDEQQIAHLINIVSEAAKVQDPNFKVNDQKLKDIIKRSQTGADIFDDRERLAKKAKNIFVSILSEKPFSSSYFFGGVIIIREYLLFSDFNLPIEKIVGLAQIINTVPKSQWELEIEKFLKMNVVKFT